MSPKPSKLPSRKRRILVIKLGALGDFIMATGAFADIRAHEPDARITLLTTPGMKPLAEKSPFFNRVIYDKRAKFWNFFYLKDLRDKLQGFDFVYDLQTNKRTSWYHYFAGKPYWSGIAKGCTHPHANPNRNNMHTLDRLADQLAYAGVPASHAPNINYSRQSADKLLKANNLKNKKYIAIVPGGSAHRPEKRWPHFNLLINHLKNKGETCVLIGGPDERQLLDEIAQKTGALNLGGQTPLPQLADVLARAKAVIGNDTGPMHMAAAVQTPSIVLFGHASNPDLCAPRGPKVAIMRKPNIASITPQRVVDNLDSLLES